MADQLEAMIERDADAICESLVAEIARANQWPQLLGAHRALTNVRRLAYVMVNGSEGAGEAGASESERKNG